MMDVASSGGGLVAVAIDDDLQVLQVHPSEKALRRLRRQSEPYISQAHASRLALHRLRRQRLRVGRKPALRTVRKHGSQLKAPRCPGWFARVDRNVSRPAAARREDGQRGASRKGTRSALDKCIDVEDLPIVTSSSENEADISSLDPATSCPDIREAVVTHVAKRQTHRQNRKCGRQGLCGQSSQQLFRPCQRSSQQTKHNTCLDLCHFSDKRPHTRRGVSCLGGPLRVPPRHIKRNVRPALTDRADLTVSDEDDYLGYPPSTASIDAGGQGPVEEPPDSYRAEVSSSFNSSQGGDSHTAVLRTDRTLMVPTQLLPRSKTTSGGGKATPTSPSTSRQWRAALALQAPALSSPTQRSPPNAAALYVEPFSEGFAPARCSACCQRFRIGAPRLGYMPECDAPSPPRWIHLRCVRCVGLCLELGRQKVAFSPNMQVTMLSGTLAALARRSCERSPGLRVQPWEYLPAVLQHWRVEIVPKAMPLPTSLPTGLPVATARVNGTTPEVTTRGAGSEVGSYGTAWRRQLSGERERLGWSTGSEHGRWIPLEEVPYQVEGIALAGGMVVSVTASEDDTHRAGQHESQALLPPGPSNEQVLRMCAVVEAVPEEVLRGRLEDTCAVCREPMLCGDAVRRLPCLHVFHKDCIDQWLLIRTTCPLDNMRLDDLIEGARDRAVP